MTTVDVAIAGGGPGGAAAAIALAKQGQRVLLADAGTGRWPRIGEGLPPSARALLRELGVLDQVLAEGHRRSPGTVAFWGSDSPHTEDSLFGLHGDGLQLDRARFDAGLRTAAHTAGAQVHECARLRLLARGDAYTPHTVELRIGEAAPQRVQARWLIDASGRSATLARALGAQRIAHDRLLAFHQRLIGGAVTDRDGRTWVESVENGWWYSVLLPSGERLIAYLSDFSGEDGAAERGALLTGEGLWDSLRLAPQLHALCAEHGWRPHGPVQGADASSTELDHAGGERWLAVGDAAMAFDPLSSKGIANALYTGVRAAGVIWASERGDADAVGGYARYLGEIHRVYREQCRGFYAMEGRWARSAFWRTRGQTPPGGAGVADPNQSGSVLTRGGRTLHDRHCRLIPRVEP
ncbi:NAD(P)/FAD-dependent oxidoreductase [Aquimonas voraii]|uniref:NAD(P)/FAD-dependent oxidoreductase n=1 Tax=Aquimonas voraii TaxID=265719 RepID=UPI0015A00BFA|nr:FAD-dependent monooxygenase [Aquimonas voraii]